MLSQLLNIQLLKLIGHRYRQHCTQLDAGIQKCGSESSFQYSTSQGPKSLGFQKRFQDKIRSIMNLCKLDCSVSVSIIKTPDIALLLNFDALFCFMKDCCKQNAHKDQNNGWGRQNNLCSFFFFINNYTYKSHSPVCHLFLGHLV